MASYSSPENQAIRTVCGRNFHQTLWLPETATHQKLRVTYATTTNFDNVSLPVILYISQMYATRWGAVFCDRRARRYGVRVICVDRYVSNLRNKHAGENDIRLSHELDQASVARRQWASTFACKFGSKQSQLCCSGWMLSMFPS